MGDQMFILLKGHVSVYKFNTKKKIDEKYIQIEKSKVITDREIIKDFSDEIWIPKEIRNKIGERLFNKILKKLSVKARKKLEN